MTEFGNQSITVSVVSHGHGRLVTGLLEDLAICPNVSAVILTQNVPEDDIPCPASLQPRLQVIHNERPLGFAANHNQAFEFSETELFAVLNSDIRLKGDPFPQMARALEMSSCGVIAPAVRNPSGDLEDSARNFPTLLRLLLKLMGLVDGRILIEGSSPQDVDWIAGMFLLFPASVYSELEGFDEGFFLYYEDVDICWRLRQKGYDIKFVPSVEVIHDARRESRKNWRYARWHLTSMARYLIKTKAWW